MLISRKRYKIETYFQWKTNRKSYAAYRMSPVLSYLKWPWRSFTVCRPFQVQSVEHLCSILPDFNWPRARAVPQRQLGFLSSSVKLHYYGRRTISGKLLATGFAATMRLLSNKFLMPENLGSSLSPDGATCVVYEIQVPKIGHWLILARYPRCEWEEKKVRHTVWCV